VTTGLLNSCDYPAGRFIHQAGGFWVWEANGKPLDLDAIQYLDPKYVEDQKIHLNETMVEAAIEDFRHITNSDQVDLSYLDAVDKYYDRAKIAELIKASDPAGK
jgi:hypothetical protein